MTTEFPGQRNKPNKFKKKYYKEFDDPLKGNKYARLPEHLPSLNQQNLILLLNILLNLGEEKADNQDYQEQIETEISKLTENCGNLIRQKRAFDPKRKFD